eukprot:6193256-Pleurochrysis_carterae.AAC.2
MDASLMVELLHETFPDLTFDISRVQKKATGKYIVIACPEERWDVTWACQKGQQPRDLAVILPMRDATDFQRSHPKYGSARCHCTIVIIIASFVHSTYG